MVREEPLRSGPELTKAESRGSMALDVEIAPPSDVEITSVEEGVNQKLL